MIAPYVSGLPYMYGLLDRYACWNVNPPLPILSAIVADYNHRRVFTRLRFAHRLRAAHLKEKEDHR
jgi:hypothetical protein